MYHNTTYNGTFFLSATFLGLLLGFCFAGEVFLLVLGLVDVLDTETDSLQVADSELLPSIGLDPPFVAPPSPPFVAPREEDFLPPKQNHSCKM